MDSKNSQSLDFEGTLGQSPGAMETSDLVGRVITPPKTNMTMEKQPFEHVYPKTMVIFHCQFLGCKSNSSVFFPHDQLYQRLTVPSYARIQGQ